MTWSAWVRQTHRWLAIVFTLTVVANFAVLGLGDGPAWIVYTPLPPLFLLMFTGLTMFVQPYAVRRRGGHVDAKQDG